MTPQPESRIRHWQDEVARDPGSAAFVPLADLYRVQGRVDVARRVCLRGLERNPDNVEGHYLLGRIHRDAGEDSAAYDEWDIALGLDPSHLPARRSIGLLCIERGEVAEAEKHLLRAFEEGGDDPRVRRALDRLRGSNGRNELDSTYWRSAGPLLQTAVDALARESRVRLLIALDTRGRILAQHGHAPRLDLGGIASLAAGIHAASGEIARTLGEPGFSQLFQGSGHHQTFIGAFRTPPAELLLIAVFGEDTTVGLVRALFVERTAKLAKADWPATGRTPSQESLDDALAAGLARARQQMDRTSRNGAV